MKVSKEIFIKQTGANEYQIYSPLSNKVISADQSLLLALNSFSKGDLSKLPEEQLEICKTAGILVEQEKKPKPEYTSFNPTNVSIFPTTDCNLRCVYCYASAGTEKKTIDFEFAKAGIDLVIGNALKIKTPKISLSFHGGGEPTYAWDILVKSTEYVRKKAAENNLRPFVSLTSNGVYDGKKLDWIVKNINSVRLSFDGPEKIQDMQRPLYKAAGSMWNSSYDGVMATVKRFQEENFPFVVRSTITKESVTALDEIVNFFISEVKPKSVHLEPLYECGRCRTTKWSAPDAETFIKNYVSALKIAKANNLRMVTSNCRLNLLASQFCGAAGRNFYITPEGYVSSCTEVSLKDDPQSEVFFYGQFDKNSGKFEINEDKRKALFSRTVDNMPSCQDCFIKWNCAGDCLVKVSRNGNLFDTKDYSRCKLNRMLSEYAIDQI